ncbi:branched-chain-amino-acid transaminase [Mammaliicoccus sciuri]|uniref:branched-chain-amino-acid transaminase n=1 Tax=Mammaliicoccus sciuri TaxID=1296 RepID=UPI0010721BE3|nr:branched-chain-amino-acid transaminase [Mammaliicoccus sciuri]MBF0773974.1 branched-chain-amino-acid transaminase [Mammaliicoccus sciuri]MCD8836644.1 branched-chain-amino-acid transaminase [Mammaliicoccus sciuri]TFU86658.1 branched-chain-amino-acid transaminase [Mammaliicoccus sciuri]WQK63590.1 branched-chain-amino-acid transaminase [Mammaliicoccus sciuri]
MQKWIFIDDKFYKQEDAKINVYDHGLLYGDGIYEGIRCYSKNIFQLDEHIERLFKSAKSIQLTIRYSKDELTDAIIQTIKKNNLENAYIRLIVTRGIGPIGPNPNLCVNSTLIIIVEDLPNIHGLKALDRGTSLAIVSTRRDSVDATSHEIKSLNYLNSIMAKMEAKHYGVDDAILLDSNGFISESTICNIFMIENKIIYTPQSSNGILKGITRKNVIEIAKELNLEVIERNITPYELINADEVFLTGTHAEIVGVTKINNIQIGNNSIGPITTKIRKKYMERTTNARFGVKV